jgi:hypothetical protein
MEYYDGIVIIVGLYVILAISFNLIIGYGGLVSIAHPVFSRSGLTRLRSCRAISVCPCHWRWWPA